MRAGRDERAILRINKIVATVIAAVDGCSFLFALIASSESRCQKHEIFRWGGGAGGKKFVFGKNTGAWARHNA